MRKSRKRNAIVLALIVLLIATAIGYAAFASTLTITGTATADGQWSVYFTTPTFSTVKTANTAVLDNDSTATTGTSLALNVKLDYPTESVTVTIPVVNDSSCAAKLTGFTITNVHDGENATVSGTNNVYTVDSKLQMSLNTEGWEANGVTIASGESEDFEMTFTWLDDGSTDVDISGSFTITMNFSQPTS